MSIDKYTIIYLLSDMFMAYVIYKYVHIFYSEFKFNRKVEWFPYIGYFLLNAYIYMSVKKPLIVMSSTILLLIGLVCLYYGSLKKAFLSAIIIFLSLLCIETIIVFLTNFPGADLFDSFQYRSEFGIISIRIVSYAFVLLMYGFKHVKSEYPLPFIYWISLVLVPFGTLVLLLIIFSQNSVPSIFIIASIGIVFIINIVTFYLYDCISNFLLAQMNKRLVEEQNKYYEHQIELMKTSLENIKIFRHDLKNKLSPIYNLAISGMNEELIERISELTETCCGNYGQIISGNSDLDSIINFKLQHADKENIKVTTKIMVPTKLSVSSFDLAVILGNLIDNSIEAVTMIESDRWISINMKYTKGRLILEISNTFDGYLKKSNDFFASRKNDQENHGLGIKSVKAAIQKYDGAMQISDTDKIFTVKILMYIQP
jgi:two-component system sensor histidine kinase AgrC